MDRLLFPQVTQSESWSLTLQNEATLFFLSIKSRLGSFSSLWMTLTECHADLFQALTFPPLARCTKAPIWQSAWGGVTEHVQSLKEKGTNGSIRQNTGNKRDERWKASSFFGGTSAYERSEGDCLYSCGSGPPQGAEPAAAVTPFPFCLYIVL